MKQSLFFQTKTFKKEHGGVLAIQRRRSRRPLSAKTPLHIVLRTDLAVGPRLLTRHRPLINGIIDKASRRYSVKVYERAICHNHIHLLVRGKKRVKLQNFFRVVAGHIAQEILRDCPLTPFERELSRWGGAQRAMKSRRGGATKRKMIHSKNQRKFWALLLYSRVMEWGKDYFNVSAYLVQNSLESLGLVSLKPRRRVQLPSELKSIKDSS